MAKPWLLFGTGLAAGLAVAFSLSALRTEPPPAPPAAPSRTAHRPSVSSIRATSTAAPATVVSSLAEKIARLQRWVDGQDPKLDRSEVWKILTEWSEADPKAVLQFVFEAKRFPGRNAALAHPLAVLCRRDATPVINWLRQNRTEEDRGTIAIRVLALMEDKSPAQAWALALADGIPVGSGPFSKALATLARQQPQQALLAYAKLSAEDQETVTASLVGALYSTDPKSAVAWAESLKASPNGKEAIAGLLQAAAASNNVALAADLLKRSELSPPQIGGLFSEQMSPEMARVILAGTPDDMRGLFLFVGSSRVDLQACKLEYSIVSPK